MTKIIPNRFKIIMFIQLICFSTVLIKKGFTLFSTLYMKPCNHAFFT